MIYTLISDLSFSTEFDKSAVKGKKLSSFHSLCAVNSGLNSPREEILKDQKRDCRILRQPLSLLPEEIKIFIENTKNKKTRDERRLAYTTLLCGVKLFFGIEDCAIAKTPDGKPYLITDIKKYQKNEDLSVDGYQHQKNIDFTPELTSKENESKNKPQLYVSISHSEGVIAVCISDEDEVGVDIQREISAHKAERLDNRFLGGMEISSDELNISYYYCHLCENEAKIEQIFLPNVNIDEFTSKWAYSESVMKLYGKGFGDLKRLNDLSLISRTEIKGYIGTAPFVIATSIKGK